MTKIIPYGNFFIDKKDIFEVNKSLKNQFITSGPYVKKLEDLAKNSDFIEVTNLLIYGDLPNKNQLNKYYRLISKHTMVHEQLLKFFNIAYSYIRLSFLY